MSHRYFVDSYAALEHEGTFQTGQLCKGNNHSHMVGLKKKIMFVYYVSLKLMKAEGEIRVFELRFV
jgi:hypothetical protein